MAGIADKTYTYSLHGETWKVRIQKRYYLEGRLALSLFSDTDGPVAKITVNIPEAQLSEGEILVKVWSENEPMAAFLIENGLASDTGKRVPAGHAEAWVMKLADGSPYA